MARISHITRAILAGVSVTALLISTPLVAPSIAPAAAQTRDSISIEFRTGLTPYGSWRTVGRWGEVWIPAHVVRGWQPYTVGNWVHSEDYGWYWISESSEAEWGWITYHYGRWAFDDSSGWVWVPDNVWGPAWVDWRRGDEYVGWSPLPPDDVIAEYRDNPRFWTFVRPLALIAPRLLISPLSLGQRQTILSRSAVVNRTSVSNSGRFAVNPGIAPATIAAAARQPVRTVEVRPHVVAGTADIRGAIEVNAEDLRRGGNRPGQSIARAAIVQKTISSVEPPKGVPPTQALKNNQSGKVGDTPPGAAVGSKQDRVTPGSAVTAPTNQRIAPAKQQQESAAPLPQRERKAPAERSGQGDQRQESTAPPQQQRKEVTPAERSNQTPGTSGQAPTREERRGPAAASQTQPTPKASTAPPASAAPHLDEKKVEDNKK